MRSWRLFNVLGSSMSEGIKLRVRGGKEQGWRVFWEDIREKKCTIVQKRIYQSSTVTIIKLK